MRGSQITDVTEITVCGDCNTFLQTGVAVNGVDRDMAYLWKGCVVVHDGYIVADEEYCEGCGGDEIPVTFLAYASPEDMS